MEQFVVELRSAGQLLPDPLGPCMAMKATIMAATAAITAATICALALVIRFPPSKRVMRMILLFRHVAIMRPLRQSGMLPPVLDPQPHWPGPTY